MAAPNPTLCRIQYPKCEPPGRRGENVCVPCDHDNFKRPETLAIQGTKNMRKALPSLQWYPSLPECKDEEHLYGKGGGAVREISC